MHIVNLQCKTWTQNPKKHKLSSTKQSEDQYSKNRYRLNKRSKQRGIHYLSQMTVNSSNKRNSEITGDREHNRRNACTWPHDDRLPRHRIGAFDRMVYVMLTTVVITNFKWLLIKKTQIPTLNNNNNNKK